MRDFLRQLYHREFLAEQIRLGNLPPANNAGELVRADQELKPINKNYLGFVIDLVAAAPNFQLSWDQAVPADKLTVVQDAANPARNISDLRRERHPDLCLTSGANVPDISRALDLLDCYPPIAGRPGWPRRRFDVLLSDKGYSSETFRQACREPGAEPIIAKPETPNIKGLGKLRYVVEQTFALLHQFRRIAVRWERRPISTTVSSASPAP